MIKITRQEADVIRKKLPNTNITIVNRTKPYKKYWCEENRDVNRLLNQLRGIKPAYTAPKNNRNGYQRRARQG